MTTVGILGGGQLGRMLALAGYPLGLRFRFLDPSPEAPAGQLAELIEGGYEDPEALRRFVEGVDAATYEFENVPVNTARFLAQRVPVYPPPEALEVAQDRLVEKSFFQRLGIPTPPFASVESRAELAAAVAKLGCPAFLKTRRFGYDGKGQVLICEPDGVARAWDVLGGVPLILEGFVKFERELSLLAVRGRDGEIKSYPLTENHHHDAMLRLSFAPAPHLTKRLVREAEDYGRRVLEAVNYVGVLAVEFFEVGGKLVANEMAPRVHNSGHWTIEGAATSQFENHLRAVLGLPLGDVTTPGHAVLINLIGQIPSAKRLLQIPSAHLHDYGKSPRPGRKLGHLTLCDVDEARVRSALRTLVNSLEDLLPEALSRAIVAEKLEEKS